MFVVSLHFDKTETEAKGSKISIYTPSFSRVFPTPFLSSPLRQKRRYKWPTEREGLPPSSIYLLYYIRWMVLSRRTLHRIVLVKDAGMSDRAPSISLIPLIFFPRLLLVASFSLSSFLLLLAPTLSMHYSGYTTHGAVRDGLTGAPPEVRQMSPERSWIVAFPRKPRPPIFHAFSHPKCRRAGGEKRGHPAAVAFYLANSSRRGENQAARS